MPPGSPTPKILLACEMAFQHSEKANHLPKMVLYLDDSPTCGVTGIKDLHFLLHVSQWSEQELKDFGNLGPHLPVELLNHDSVAEVKWQGFGWELSNL